MEDKSEKIKNLAKFNRALKSTLENYNHETSLPRCDKHGLVFNTDDRFSCIEMRISLDNWMGYYGNSGCSTRLVITDKSLFKSYFEKYLNKHVHEILNFIIEASENDIIEGKYSVITELKNSLEEWENLGKEL